jgi:beta-phosphoglucomutase-like phosphatase (HAD superfamily)
MNYVQTFEQAFKPTRLKPSSLIWTACWSIRKRIWFVAEEDDRRRAAIVYTAEAREQIIGMRMDEFMVNCAISTGCKEPVDALCDELVERLMAIIETEIKPQPGAHELIDYVTRQNIPRAIASSSPIEVIDATLEAQGWKRCFPIRCTADDEPRGKPAPDVYLAAARRWPWTPPPAWP